jgi:ribosomal protein S27AE
VTLGYVGNYLPVDKSVTSQKTCVFCKAILAHRFNRRSYCSHLHIDLTDVATVREAECIQNFGGETTSNAFSWQTDKKYASIMANHVNRERERVSDLDATG